MVARRGAPPIVPECVKTILIKRALRRTKVGHCFTDRKLKKALVDELRKHFKTQHGETVSVPESGSAEIPIKPFVTKYIQSMRRIRE